MISISQREWCPSRSSRANIYMLIVAISLGSALVRCQTGGFGSPPPGPGQCDATGPRIECGTCPHCYVFSFTSKSVFVRPSHEFVWQLARLYRPPSSQTHNMYPMRYSGLTSLVKGRLMIIICKRIVFYGVERVDHCRDDN